MIRERQSWRDLQNDLNRKKARRKLIKRLPRLFVVIPLFFVAFYLISLGFRDNAPLEASVDPTVIEKNPARISKSDVRKLIDLDTLTNIHDKRFDIRSEDKVLHVETSIDMDLQEYIYDQIDYVKTLKRGKPRYLAVVVVDPQSGKVLSMAGFNSKNPDTNPCLSTEFPAASVFKIVTAAAAVEQCGLSPASGMKFNGGKYTLYKRQLKDKTNKHTNRISFQDSFAQSINPVFGKLGYLYLGKSTLEKYGQAFGFNQIIDFEASLPQSELTLSDEPYQWAEIACGFNRDTVLSPLHGALLPSVVLNDGQFIEPTIIDRITDEEGHVIYHGEGQARGQAIRPETTAVLKKLMSATITRGTGKKSFRGYKKDPVLGKLSIGGKTGSIYNKSHDVRLDWFVGFAESKKGSGKVVLSVLVGHEKYIGTKACKYARKIIKYYFQNQDDNQLLANHDQENIDYKVR